MSRLGNITQPNVMRREPYVRVGRVESHPSGGWQIRVKQKSGDDVVMVAPDGSGLTTREAERLLNDLDQFVAERN